MRIGRTTRVLVDLSRDNPFMNDGSNRRIMISIYYPTPESNSQERESAYPELFHPGVKTAKAFFSDFGADLDYLNTLMTNVYNEAEIADGVVYPIMLYSPAFGIERDMYWFNIKNLVTNGFVVVTIAAPFESVFTVFSDGEHVQQLKSLADLNRADRGEWLRLVEIRTEDIRFVMRKLDELVESDELLRQRIDLHNISAIGHSLGGAAVFKALQDDSNIKSAILLDPSLHLLGTSTSSVHRPLLLLRQQSSTYEMLLKEGWNEALARETIQGQIHLASVLTGYKSFLRVHNANHVTFSDALIHFNEADIGTKHDVINHVIASFLQEFVHDKPGEYTNHITKIAGVCPINRYGTPLS